MDMMGLTYPERLLLMAASVQGLGPRHTLTYANTARIVNQALGWLGFSGERTQELLHDETPNIAHRVYDVLVWMTRQELRDGGWRPQQRPGAPLFDGSGNWGVPDDPESPACLPYFNSCRLTSQGSQLAKALLRQFPEYKGERYSDRITRKALSDDKWASALMRDIFGAPVHAPRIGAPWLTTVVTRLAEAIYGDKAFDRLPILADALEEAGCTSRTLLKHMRKNAEHVRGCWALDLVLARQ
jgi:hypothetical protein